MFIFIFLNFHHLNPKEPFETSLIETIEIALDLKFGWPNVHGHHDQQVRHHILKYLGHRGHRGQTLKFLRSAPTLNYRADLHQSLRLLQGVSRNVSGDQGWFKKLHSGPGPEPYRDIFWNTLYCCSHFKPVLCNVLYVLNDNLFLAIIIMRQLYYSIIFTVLFSLQPPGSYLLSCVVFINWFRWTFCLQ
jgi:hypothetical protein